MTAKKMRGAAAAVLGAVALLVGGCGGGGGGNDATNLRGSWTGSLTVTFEGGGGLSGGITLELAQTDDFFNGGAQWTAIGVTQSVSGPIDGDEIELRLNFRCEKGTENAVLPGVVDGETITISGGTGKACAANGPAVAVAGATGSFTRTRDNQPL